MNYMTKKESPQREQLNYVPFCWTDQNTLNNLPVMKYVILQQMKFAIWGKKVLVKCTALLFCTLTDCLSGFYFYIFKIGNKIYSTYTKHWRTYYQTEALRRGKEGWGRSVGRHGDVIWGHDFGLRGWRCFPASTSCFGAPGCPAAVQRTSRHISVLPAFLCSFPLFSWLLPVHLFCFPGLGLLLDSAVSRSEVSQEQRQLLLGCGEHLSKQHCGNHLFEELGFGSSE